jgi:hypothetical protein
VQTVQAVQSWQSSDPYLEILNIISTGIYRTKTSCDSVMLARISMIAILESRMSLTFPANDRKGELPIEKLRYFMLFRSAMVLRFTHDLLDQLDRLAQHRA